MTSIVLVVDDEPVNLSLATDILEAGGFTVLVAQSADDGLAILADVLVDLVLLDAVMPGKDGFQMCRIMKAVPDYRDIPVVFMTGLSGQDDIVQAFEAGSVDYIVKPIQPAELLARTRTHLDNARKTKKLFRAINFSGRHFLATDREGVVQWFSPQVPSIIGSIASHDTTVRLPVDTLRWLQACINSPSSVDASYRQQDTDMEYGVEFSFMGQPEPDEFLVRLAVVRDGQDVTCLQIKLGLTVREAEVLYWVAKGKTNRDIAEILSISHRTVNKHLEQIYIKIGVENRAAATARVLQALHG
ncbi:two component response regulator LuxR [Acetobacter aceti NRIC 0242]|uniref:DNA-binding response regulator n=1 Tax=Acetobacter aceti NBRC 14818 TaxID=887700 RepID=A0AB33IH36_ACEAC|nr:DNA-binding response regulator [Acetobacter aceti]TCS29389.1 LuxR family two component transcriptional regulator [Acetobacter aceti NBRC 14818]BCK76518.1 DNA-binding response regulator [Acetobacter aceti NBRC 14818]GAN57243.1 two component transcriptional regulator LuxR [Acetobacter aceti NBRC 14818]GBO82332.1 two component response regulator LuxR [Acetobacter aceti NRIC 0242]